MTSSGIRRVSGRRSSRSNRFHGVTNMEIGALGEIEQIPMAAKTM